MSRRIVAAMLSLSLLLLGPQVHAAPKPGAADKSAQSVAQGPRKHLGNIVFAGLAGAILGLSTLSFYGRPQDRLSNIAVGFAIGIISGTMFTTYKAAAEPKEFYGLREPQSEAWRLVDEQAQMQRPSPMSAAVTFNF